MFDAAPDSPLLVIGAVLVALGTLIEVTLVASQWSSCEVNVGSLGASARLDYYCFRLTAGARR